MKLSVLLVALIFLASCEGYIRLSGKIVNENSNDVVKDGSIELLDIGSPQYFDTASQSFKDFIFRLDSAGLFMVHSRLIGMVTYPKYRIRITKKGFETKEIRVTKKTMDMYRDSVNKLFVVKMKPA